MLNGPFGDWDKNRNGVITGGEWRGDGGSFEYYDRNRDGVLTREELRGRIAPIQRRG